MELAYSNIGIKGLHKPKAKVITITSGKGGVGKSSTATNLALALMALNKKVCVFDADASLANINILLGIQPEFTLQHLLKGEKSLKEIIIDGPRGLKVVPGATGISEYTRLSQDQKAILLAALDKLQSEFDYLIIDTAAGIGDDVLDFIRASQFSIIIITPEPTSLTDSFSLLKVLKRTHHDRDAFILVNMAMDYENSKSIYKRFESAVKKYIDVGISYIGYIQADETMISSVTLQCPAILLSPDSKATQCFNKLALELDKNLDESPIDSFSDFWRKQNSIQKIVETALPDSTTPSFASQPAPKVEKTKEPTPLDFQQASEFCLKQLSAGNLTDDEKLKFLTALDPFQIKEEESVSTELVEALDSSSSSVREFYNYLEQNSFPQEEIRDVVTTLEQVYLKKYKQDINGLDAIMLKLFSQLTDDEDELLYVESKLSARYQRQFDKPLHEPIQQIIKLINSESKSQHEIDEVLGSLLSAYKDRFSQPYKTKADEELFLATQVIKDLKNHQKEISSQLKDAENSLTKQTNVLESIKQLLPNLNDKP